MSLLQLRQALQDHQLAAMIITQSVNRQYLSGFTGSAGVLLITPDQQFLLTDSRYYEQVTSQSPTWTLVKAGYKTAAALQSLLAELGVTPTDRIGLEADHVTLATYQSWQSLMPDQSFVLLKNLIAEIRMVKTEAELEKIRRAVSIADEAMAYLYQWIQPGMRETDVAWELEVQFHRLGADGLAFDTIVAAGPNGALPHARPTERVIERNDIVVVDMGCVVDGYASDVTRTFSIGQPRHENYLDIWHLVDRANVTAVTQVQAGMSGRVADALARDVIAAAGYGDNFGHSLGHGVGLDVHELPRVSYATDDPLPANSVITIEPGVYLPDQFGIRLEDMIVVGDDGVEVLTGVPKIAVLDR